MQNADSVFQEVREILGVSASMVPQATASITLQSFLDKGVQAWVSALQGTDLQIPWSAEELRLHGSYLALEEGQVGYRVDASGNRFQKWQDNWIVLGEISGDPIIGIAEQNDCAIFFARHGSGSWKANLVSSDVVTFAMVLRVWCELFIVKYSKDIYDDTLAVRSDFLEELRDRVSKIVSASQVDVFMSMVDG